MNATRPEFRLNIFHRLDVLQDQDGGYYGEVYDDARTTRIHTTTTYPRSEWAADAARAWDRKHKS
jgi:hypothetical protein